MTCGGILLGIIAIFFPPAAVIVRRGCGADVLICIGLLFLGWIPGVVYAWFIILSYHSLRQRRRKSRRSYDGVTREEVIYDGPIRRSESRRRSGHHAYEGTMQPYHRREESGWRGGGGQIGYYPPPPMSEGRGRRY